MKSDKIGIKLEKAAGCTVTWDRYMLDFYSVDASSYKLKPQVIAFPRNEKDIAKIIRFAKKHLIPVTPRGGGTGLVGGALGKGIILDMRNFNKIKIGKNHVTVGSGVYKGHLDKILQKQGRFVGPDPSIGPFCTIGGMVGNNSSGVHSLKYGSVIDNLIEVKIMDSTGNATRLQNMYHSIKSNISQDVIKSFPRVSKNSCGYRIDRVLSEKDVHKLIAGSEGTLGIITSAKLRTYKMPKSKSLCIIHYKTLLQASIDSAKILTLKPAALEVIDKNITRHIKMKIPNSGCLIFAEFDNDIKHNIKQIQKITSGKIIKVESNKGNIRKLWSFRNSALALSLRSITKKETMPTLIEDSVVPVKRLPLLLNMLDMIEKKYHLRTIVYGHIGNGNLHIRPVLGYKDISKIQKIATEFFTGVIGIGGSITGEHGDGLARSEFVKTQYGDKTYAVFRNIKQQFDPQNILNPGKIISDKKTMIKNLKI
ncbi:MAG: FAD-binding oxidoreductase [Thaumarchaeota archaeon]|nr:FAD-binding oxidoreductase [Nitrososphaerota archaeon]